jgi:hypothetical protein
MRLTYNAREVLFNCCKNYCIELFFHRICIYSQFFFKSAVLSSWYEELKIANSAFHDVDWQRRAVQGHLRCHCA